MSVLLDKLADLHARFAQLEIQIADTAVMGGPEYQQVLRQHARLSRLMAPYKDLLQAESDREAAQELLGDADMKEMAQAEIDDCGQRIEELTEKIKALLVQADEVSDRPAIIEIRGGAGGDEACLFAGDLARMYQLFCQRQGWQFSVLSVAEGEAGGVKEGTFLIKGEGAYGMMRFESGGHRVQRVPATESQGRIHTSAATVAVMPEVEAVDVDIDQSDLRIDTYRASGAGGQHVNKTESAIRIVHIPTDIVVTCQDQKSQHANKDRAMQILRAKLFDFERQRSEAERAANRKEQVGTGDRSDRIRTYNYPQNRITDHRIGFKSNSLDRYLEGHIEELQQAMIDHAKAEVLENWDGNY